VPNLPRQASARRSKPLQRSSLLRGHSAPLLSCPACLFGPVHKLVLPALCAARTPAWLCQRFLKAVFVKAEIFIPAYKAPRAPDPLAKPERDCQPLIQLKTGTWHRAAQFIVLPGQRWMAFSACSLGGLSRPARCCPVAGPRARSNHGDHQHRRRQRGRCVLPVRPRPTRTSTRKLDAATLSAPASCPRLPVMHAAQVQDAAPAGQGAVCWRGVAWWLHASFATSCHVCLGAS
jgi:hypothetical protein